ncbi:hypothetical protein GN156_13305 [bacterium LRH843]|nr:hypothetical protein [bacterium LRH843]
MKKAILLPVFILISILIVTSFPSMTSACSCVESSVEEQFDRSTAVFSGKVIDIREKKSKGRASKSVLFEVIETWKGVQQSQIIITTGLGGGDCGIDFKEGEEYLVFASESTMYGTISLVSIICDGTDNLSSSYDDLAILGEGQPPIEEVDLSGNQNGNQMYIWGTVLIALGIFVTILFKKRRKSNK